MVEQKTQSWTAFVQWTVLWLGLVTHHATGACDEHWTKETNQHGGTPSRIIEMKTDTVHNHKLVTCEMCDIWYIENFYLKFRNCIKYIILQYAAVHILMSSKRINSNSCHEPRERSWNLQLPMSTVCMKSQLPMYSIIISMYLHTQHMLPQSSMQPGTLDLWNWWASWRGGK